MFKFQKKKKKKDVPNDILSRTWLRILKKCYPSIDNIIQTLGMLLEILYFTEDDQER